MLLLTLLLFGAVCGSFAVVYVCPGVNMPITDLNQYKGTLYFTPERPVGTHKKKLMDNGKAINELIGVLGGKVYLKKLSKAHEGTYEARLRTGPWELKIKLLECVERHYLDDFKYEVPYKAFSLIMKPTDSNPIVLWDLNNHPEETYVKDKKWIMDSLTQANSGVYYFRDRDDAVISRVKLTVKENTFEYKLKVNENVSMEYPWIGGPWNIRFISKDKEKMLMKEGQLSLADTEFGRRITFQNKILQINALKTTDTGTFNFRDKEDNLAMSVQLNVISETNHAVTAGAVCAAVVLLIVGGCCYWKCCKDGDSENAPNESPPAPSNATTVNPPQPDSSSLLLTQANPAYPPQYVPISYPPVLQPNHMYPPQPVPNLYPQVAPSPAPCS